MSSNKDIDKLREKLEKDPDSKSFVPLAEEYRKRAMLDEAAEVLMKGLNRQPGYTSARVLLGKIYLEQAMSSEARREFETVIKAVPDNLFALKKLAEIYRDIGEKELTVKTLKQILRLHPADEEAKNNLRNIEALTAKAITEENKPIAEVKVEKPINETVADAAEIVSEEKYEEKIDEEPQVKEPGFESEYSDDELKAFKESLFGERSVLENKKLSAAEGEAPEEGLIPEDEHNTGMFFQDITLDMKEEKGSITEIFPKDIEEIVAQQEETKQPAEEAPTADDADRHISEGNYEMALSIYKRILKTDPYNSRTRQRAEELRALLKLLGRDKEKLVEQMNAFL